MPAIEQAGTFKGVIKDSNVNLTRKAKLPQLVVTLLATGYHDEVNEVWDDWVEYGGMITGYLVLVTKDEQGRVVKCFAYDQIMEAVGWDGETYSGLNAMDLKNKKIKFQVIEDTFEDTIRYKVNAIASEDGDIGLQKLDDKTLAKLDAEFGLVSSKPKTATKPKPKPKTKPKTTPPKKVSPPKTTQKAESCTAEEAYQACVDANAKLVKPVPDQILEDYWCERAGEFAADPDNVTDKESVQVRDAVLADIEIPF